MSSISADFEEKEFEIPLYFELLGTPGRLWSPGQVLEARLGIDCAVRASDAYWKLVRRKRKPGVSLQGLFMAAGMSTPAAPPTFAVNLLIQAKRPHYYPTGKAPQKLSPDSSGALWHCFWRTKHQQLLLEQLAIELSAAPGRPAVADVSYASPCFSSRLNLWQHTMQRRLVPNSTFPLAIRLSGHVRWAYTRPGASGTALSTPEEVDDPDLGRRLTELVERTSVPTAESTDGATDGTLAQLKHLHKSVMGSLHSADLPALDLREIESDATDVGLPERLAAEISANLAVHGIVWLAVGSPHSGQFIKAE